MLVEDFTRSETLVTHTIHSCMSTAVVAQPALNLRGWVCY